MTPAARHITGILVVVTATLGGSLWAWHVWTRSLANDSAKGRDPHAKTSKSPIARARLEAGASSAAPGRAAGSVREALHPPAIALAPEPLFADTSSSPRLQVAPTAPSAVPEREPAMVSAPTHPLALAIMDPPDRPKTEPPAPRPEETALRGEISAILGRNPGAELSFAVCQAGEPCLARVQSRELDVVTKVAEEAKDRFQGRAQVEVSERPTAYSGRFFVADIRFSQ